MKQRINMIDQLLNAWKRRNTISDKEFIDEFSTMFHHAFDNIEKTLINKYKELNKKYQDDLFYTLQRVLVYLMLSDDGLQQEEYDSYVSFCKHIDFLPLDIKSIQNMFSEISFSRAVINVNLIKNIRTFCDEALYEELTKALIYLCLLGDKEMDKEEYELIKCFYDPAIDIYPKSLEEFKKYWI